MGEDATFYNRIYSTVVPVVKHPIFLIIFIGLFIRLVLMPLFTYDFDVSFWATTIQNAQSGDGLYNMPGYYYSPVWGYILGVVSSIGNIFFDLSTMGVHFDQLVPLETMWMDQHTAAPTTIWFNVMIKIPLIICDLLVGILIYYLIKERTKDLKKAQMGFAFWFLCPLTIFISSVHGTFDVFSAFFMLLTVFMLYKNHYFLAGASFSAAVLTKWFPAMAIFLLVAYILAKYKDDRDKMVKSLVSAIAGTSLALLILMIPMIMEGTVQESLSFIFGRLNVVTSSGDSLKEVLTSIGMFVVTVIAQPLIVGICAFIAYKLYRTDRDKLDDRFFTFMLLTMTIILCWGPSPQYLLILLPFLIMYVLITDRKYMTPLVIISIGATIFAFSFTTFSILMSLGAYTDIISLDTVIGLMEWAHAEIWGISVQRILFAVGGAMEVIGIWLILLYWYRDSGGLKKRSEAVI